MAPRNEFEFDVSYRHWGRDWLEDMNSAIGRKSHVSQRPGKSFTKSYGYDEYLAFLTHRDRKPIPTPHFATSPTYYKETKASTKISERHWKKLEEKSQDEQKKFLEKYLKEGKFKVERVDGSRRNISKGDEIFYRGTSGGFYNHHLLCTDVQGNKITIREWTGPRSGFGASSRSVASSNPLAFAAIVKETLTYEQLEKKKAKVRKWPEELQRYTPDEVCSRSEFRSFHEIPYHLFDNNCEHFVIWCKCGLNTSLQVEPWYRDAWEGVKTVAGATKEGLKAYAIRDGIPTALKTVGNLSDEITGGISSSLAPVGYAVGAAVEVGFAGWSIYQDYKKKKAGILSNTQFKVNTVTTCAKATGHIAGGIVGSVVGSAFGLLGSALGGAIGYGVGHVFGSAVGWCYKNAPKIKEGFQKIVVAPVKKAWEGVKTVAKKAWEGVKTVAKKALEGVKGFFSSLFSW